MENKVDQIKVTLPKWRVTVCMTVCMLALWPIALLPKRARDWMTDALTSRLARWIGSGARIG